MSLCYSDAKTQVERYTNFTVLEKNLDSLGQLCTFKKLVYTGGTSDLNVRHNKATVYMNLKSLYQDKFQNIQKFWDQYMAMHKVCDKLDLKFSRCINDARTILREKGAKKLTT